MLPGADPLHIGDFKLGYRQKIRFQKTLKVFENGSFAYWCFISETTAFLNHDFYIIFLLSK